jgi:hypothetical protein
MTTGQKFRKLNPAWKHDCCWAGDCYHRATVRGRKECHGPNPCDYYVPPRKAGRGRVKK